MDDVAPHRDRALRMTRRSVSHHVRRSWRWSVCGHLVGGRRWRSCSARRERKQVDLAADPGRLRELAIRRCGAHCSRGTREISPCLPRVAHRGARAARRYEARTARVGGPFPTASPHLVGNRPGHRSCSGRRTARSASGARFDFRGGAAQLGTSAPHVADSRAWTTGPAATPTSYPDGLVVDSTRA